MPSSPESNPVIRFLQKIEDGLLIVLLLSMITMAALQIFLRNVFSSGILWADGFVRILVLWIGLLGAMIASRDNHHISIDVISRYLPNKARQFSSLLTSIFTAGICSTMTVFSFKFVIEEKEGGMMAFASVPAWVCESIIPISFCVISIRYIIYTVETIIKIIKQPK